MRAVGMALLTMAVSTGWAELPQELRCEWEPDPSAVRDS